MRTSCRITPLPVICLLLLSACATRPVDIVEQGGAPNLTGGRGVALAQTSGTDGASNLAGALIAQLRGAGIATDAGANAAYLLDVAYSERPWPVGAYAGRAAPAADARDGWVAPPQPRPWWAPRTTQVCTLAVRVVYAAQGGEAYRVRASTRGRGAACGRGEGLTAAVAAKLKPSF